MNGERTFPNVASHTAIQSVCAWPNLQIMPSGELLAFIFNQPCHGKWEGDLDCWSSADQGETWQFRGRPAPHEPGTNRMNCAAGFANKGDLVVLCGGWSGRGPRGEAAKEFQQALHPWICRSNDGGKTWNHTDDFPRPDARAHNYVPFGNIRRTADGMLAVSCYCKLDVGGYESYLFRSEDDGRSWKKSAVINPNGNETDILHLGDGRWLASSREETTRHVELFRSDDYGHTWRRSGPLTLPEQHTSHLLRLRDGRVLLSYGNRCRNNAGVEVRTSDDEGDTWGPPVRLADTPSADCGYPSTVQLDDSRMLTAYYTQISGAYHYEMRVTAWTTAMIGKKKD
jgi:hypothetical protein